MTPALHPADPGLDNSLTFLLERCDEPRVAWLADALGEASPAVLAHGVHVAELCLAMAARAGLHDERLGLLARAALLHDLGKQWSPPALLDKAAPLALHERQIVEAHAALGCSMLLEAGLVAEATIVRHHHERWDGAGYPDRLFGTSIPYESRLILVADAFDAMTSDRAYRRALRRDVALAEIAAGAGTQFDPACAWLLPEVL